MMICQCASWMKSELRLLSEVCTETETGPDCISGIINKIQVKTEAEHM